MTGSDDATALEQQHFSSLKPPSSQALGNHHPTKRLAALSKGRLGFSEAWPLKTQMGLDDPHEFSASFAPDGDIDKGSQRGGNAHHSQAEFCGVCLGVFDEVLVSRELVSSGFCIEPPEHGYCMKKAHTSARGLCIFMCVLSRRVD